MHEVQIYLDDDITIGKTLIQRNVEILVRFVFSDDSKYYPQFFLKEGLCQLKKYYFVYFING